jgi:hypothetical protein
MENEIFQELVIEKLEKLARRQSNLECDFKSMLKMMKMFSEKLDKSECDFKSMFTMMEKFSEKLDKIEGTVVKIENNSTAKAEIHDYHLAPSLSSRA